MNAHWNRTRFSVPTACNRRPPGRSDSDEGDAVLGISIKDGRGIQDHKINNSRIEKIRIRHTGPHSLQAMERCMHRTASSQAMRNQHPSMQSMGINNYHYPWSCRAWNSFLTGNKATSILPPGNGNQQLSLPRELWDTESSAALPVEVQASLELPRAPTPSQSLIL